jgi:hypothetical protein
MTYALWVLDKPDHANDLLLASSEDAQKGVRKSHEGVVMRDKMHVITMGKPAGDSNRGALPSCGQLRSSLKRSLTTTLSLCFALFERVSILPVPVL